MKKRQQWFENHCLSLVKIIIIINCRDQAIELADKALKLTKDQRLEEFDKLLDDAPRRKNKHSKISKRI